MTAPASPFVLRTALWHLRHGGPRAVAKYRRRLRVPAAVPAAATRAAGGLDFAPAQWPERAPVHPGVTAAVILDDFSRRAFAYEWNQVPLTRDGWREQLAAQPVDLLFVESAWHGNGDEWQYQLTGASGVKQPFRDLLAHCREQGIPTVFWNKEDPPHYEDFLECAGLFDHVFTTDSGRVESYVRDLGHDRVGVLPFAAQPAVHRPVRPARGFHARDVAFAGMYFAHKYPERRAQMDLLLGGAADVSPRMEHGLEIFSRYLGDDERYQFPAPLDERVVGSLPYERMLTAYKAYKVFLNVNSVVDSPSMCARRIFEITASGTPVVSTPSAAIRHYFPADELPVAEDREHAGDLVRALVRSPELADRMVHRAQRTIWTEHTYSHRVAQVLSAALPGQTPAPRLPSVSVLLSTNRPHQLGHALGRVAAQVGVDPELVLVCHGFDPVAHGVAELVAASGLSTVRVLEAGDDSSLGECLNLAVRASNGEVLAKMDDDDWYGPHYLLDQLHALRYSGADLVGKQAHYMYVASQDATLLRFAEREHRFTDFVMGPTITGHRAVFERIPFERRTTGEDSAFLAAAVDAGHRIYSGDRFNFRQYRGTGHHTWDVSDAHALASGEVKLFGAVLEHLDV
ncbi:glycosyltransferase [Kocuria sp. SM24M-10]|uniref:glycosyltransferase family protein n=1 Tax=Kocuria sp. SM24M-10 TaxID=1660349 RepID=UPI00064971D1|nr:glycosyltransferase [Kocuria sp. SM24M-10]KLU10381.1 glycosyltransferase [Kocuria sp. SM24M-10]